MCDFEKIFAVDFEFRGSQGAIPTPVCVVFQELHSGETTKVWLDDSESFKAPPYPLDESCLFVAYFGSAEWNCHLALNWPLPANVIDLYAEFRALTNGLPGVSYGLLGACEYYGVPTISTLEKDDMRTRILQGPPYSTEEMKTILDYCESDVKGTAELYKRMLQDIDVPRALFRGRYMEVVAEIENNGIPIDCETLNRLSKHWTEIERRLILEMDKEYNVYEGKTFKALRFETYLNKTNIPWPRTEGGHLDLKYETFKSMAKTYPQLEGLRDLRYILSKLRLSNLAIGPDGRNRALLSPFRTKTGRNAPSNSRFIFGPAVWLRGLIKPESGTVLVYIDYSQQEFCIAAVLSDDSEMQKAYESGDPYLKFAQQAGAAPPDATKSTHGSIRDKFKICSLGVQYGMEKESLALQLGQLPAYAKELIHHHKRVYSQYWRWCEHVLDSTLLCGEITTCYGWRFIPIGRDRKAARTIKNFPSQATGAEILRVACTLLSDARIKIAAPVHDALLIECDENDSETTIELAQQLMETASEIVLGPGHGIRTDATIIRYPDRYADKRGVETWQRIMKILSEIKDGTVDSKDL